MIIADLKSIHYCGVSSKNDAQLLMLDPAGYHLKLLLTIGEKIGMEMIILQLMYSILN